MRVRFIPFAVIVGLTVGACGSGGGADPTSPPVASPSVTSASPSATHASSPTPTRPSVPTDVPTTGPNLLHKGEQPPLMPPEATQHTQDGAVAFAKFFIQTIDWAYASTSTTYMQHYFRTGCITCKSIQDGIDKAAAEQHHFIGDRLTIKNVADVGPTTEHGAEVSLVVTFNADSAEVVDSHGQFVNGDIARTLTNRVWLMWTSGRWTVTEFGPVA